MAQPLSVDGRQSATGDLKFLPMPIITATSTRPELGQWGQHILLDQRRVGPGGPWNAQANILQALTEAHNQLGTGMNFANAYLKDAFPLP